MTEANDQYLTAHAARIAREFAALDPALAARRQAENRQALSASLISAQRYAEQGNRRAAARHAKDAQVLSRRFPRSAGGGTR